MFVLATFLLLGAIGFVPLLGGAGYEPALVAGLIAPSLCALDVRRRIGRRLALERSLEGPELARLAIGTGASHALAVFVVALLHTLRVGPCEPWSGALELLLGPGAGTLLAAAVAAAVTAAGFFANSGSAEPRARAAPRGAWVGFVLVLLVGPLGSALAGGLLFYGTPAVYAFDPFVGYFRGPLYDVVQFEPERLLVYRAGTACTLGALLALLRGLSLRRAPLERPRARLLPGAHWLVFALFALGSAVHVLSAGQLGFMTTEARLARELPGRAVWGGCTVRYGLDVPAPAAHRTARECSGQLLALRTRLGLRERWPVRVLLFSGASEKAAFMGAGTTYIAKPWRREVYIQVGDYPHPVLGHELAHVVLGELGSGPFRIAGHLGGVVPDPGRIEGFAVFAAPREGGEGTTRQWAAAMLRVSDMPPVESVFGMAFLGASAARSYTVAGAFVEYVFERYGADVAKRWYGGADLPALSGDGWRLLDRDFRAWLTRTEVPPSVLSLAELRFAAPGLFGRRCPHAAERALGLADLACSTQPSQVGPLIERAIALDSSKAESRCLVPGCLASAGALAEASERARALLEQPGAIGDPNARSLLELLGDMAWARGDRRGAAAEYERASRIAVGAAEERALSLKIWALSADQVPGEAVYRLLARAPLPSEAGGAGPFTSAGFDRARGALEAWRQLQPADGTPSYLLALGTAGADPKEAVRLFDEAVERGVLTPEFELEARARTVVLLAMTGELSDAERRLGRIQSLAEQVPLARLRAEQLQALIGRERLALGERDALTERSGDKRRPRRRPKRRRRFPRLGALLPGVGGAGRGSLGCLAGAMLLLGGGCQERGKETPPKPSTSAPGSGGAQAAVKDADGARPRSGSGGGAAGVGTPELGSGGLAGAVRAVCPVESALIPAGSFWVGSAKETYDREENPRFRAAVGEFCADRYEVSAAEYEACVQAGKCTAPATTGKTCNTVDKGRGSHPVNCVDHAQAARYCAERAARLPSEVEWEYLARGGSQMLKFPWGDAESDGHLCWKWHQSCERGQFGAGAFGLYDVVGNVWEWTDSWFGPYPWPAGSGRHRVLRGASWSRRFDKWLSPTLRNRVEPSASGSHLGFRCVSDPPTGACPTARDRNGRCQPMIESVECLDGLAWNGLRCARAGVTGCAEGSRQEPGRGCVTSLAPTAGDHDGDAAGASQLDLSAVSRARSPEFDEDCRTNQPKRPVAYRFSGGEHLARNAVVKSGACKNRDVGVGWNSACCPGP